MKFKAEINVMPKKELLDPQGKTVGKNMNNVGISGIENVRIGKRIELLVEADSKDAAKGKVEDACTRILSNQVMEFYEYIITEA